MEETLTPPPLEVLDRGEALFQTRRSIDRAKHAGTRPVGPAFIIIGAQKSGTTALYEYMHQHDLIVKGRRRESHAFDWRWEDKAKVVITFRHIHIRYVYSSDTSTLQSSFARLWKKNDVFASTDFLMLTTYEDIRRLCVATPHLPTFYMQIS